MEESERFRELGIGVSEERTCSAIVLPFRPTGVDTICDKAMDDSCTLFMIPVFFRAEG
jgi:hypothetical protein